MRRLLRIRPLAIVLALLALPALTACAGGQAESGAKATSEVQIYKGKHTIYHSLSSLPSGTQPQKDGRFTLVWFSATY